MLHRLDDNVRVDPCRSSTLLESSACRPSSVYEGEVESYREGEDKIREVDGKHSNSSKLSPEVEQAKRNDQSFIPMAIGVFFSLAGETNVPTREPRIAPRDPMPNLFLLCCKASIWWLSNTKNNHC
jgi:hypothetical protein